MTLAHNLQELLGIQNCILKQCLAQTDEGEVMMLYDNIYSLGHIFQTFLQDVPERLNHGREVLTSSNASCAGEGATLSSRLLTWLDGQNIVIDVGHKATLLQIANAFEALSGTRDTVQPLTMS